MKKSFLFLIFATSLIWLITTSSHAQKQDSIITAFTKYAELPREIAYLHLNKSIYIKGENIGFNAYVFDKNTKKPSNLTTNLYCTISNLKNEIIKGQMIKVNHGYASGVFKIDSLFNSNNYQIKAYTNWMKNFNEENVFIENITIIDSDTDNFITSKPFENKIDAQFLPEGGHLVNDIQNTIGVIIKDANGAGIAEINGDILDDLNNTITSFKTNKMGIGRLLLTPKGNTSYKAKIEYLDKSFIFNINNIKQRGINLSLTDLGENIAIKLRTNTSTLPDIKTTTFKLVIHNGNNIKVTDLSFKNLEVLKLIKKVDLNSGINIFTVFDKKNNPLLERLYFNHDNVNILNIDEPNVSQASDSIYVNFSVDKLDVNIKNNMSVSILHPNNKVYTSHHNIASYILLQPYIKDYIENGAYYFQNIDKRKKHELDNLLITQGWSSYNWNSIFNEPPTNTFAFENGIGLKANIFSKKSNQYIMFALRESEGGLFVVHDDEKSFIKTGLFPKDGEKIKIGKIDNKGKMDDPSLSIQFSPTRIPDYRSSYNVLNPFIIPSIKDTQIQPFTESFLEATQQLDEVIIKANKRETRKKEIELKSWGRWGRIDLFDDRDRMLNRSLAIYLNKRGYNATDNAGQLVIRRGNPVFFLDGNRLYDYSFLGTLDMGTVDYIVINKFGIGAGEFIGRASIRIFTDPNIQYKKKYGGKYGEYLAPLVFSNAKTFYTPVYNSYNSTFFKNFGVIDWKPNLSVNLEGNIGFFVSKTAVEDEIKIFIEGIDSEGNFVIDEKIINVN